MLNPLKKLPDRASRRTAARMLVTPTVATGMSLFTKAGYRLNFFIAMIGLAIMVTVVLAMRARQPFNAPQLNYWDETVVYIAISMLALPFSGG